MVDYRLKLIHDEYDTINFKPIRQKINTYPRQENNCGDDSIMFLPDYGNLCDTVIAENTDLSINKMYESIYLVLSYIHIGGTKYRI